MRPWKNDRTVPYEIRLGASGFDFIETAYIGEYPVNDIEGN